MELLASGIMDAVAYVGLRGYRACSRKINLLGVLNAWERMSWGVHEPQIVGAWKSIWESTTVFTLFLYLVLVTAR